MSIEVGNIITTDMLQVQTYLIINAMLMLILISVNNACVQPWHKSRHKTFCASYQQSLPCHPGSLLL